MKPGEAFNKEYQNSVFGPVETKDIIKQKPLVVELGCGSGSNYLPIIFRVQRKDKQNKSFLSPAENEFYLNLLGGKNFKNSVNYVGIDKQKVEAISSTAVDLGFSPTSVSFKNADIFHNIPLPDESADIIISRGVERLDSESAYKFSEIDRILKPDGRLAIDKFFVLRKKPNFGLPANYVLERKIEYEPDQGVLMAVFLFRKQK